MSENTSATVTADCNPVAADGPKSGVTDQSLRHRVPAAWFCLPAVGVDDRLVVVELQK